MLFSIAILAAALLVIFARFRSRDRGLVHAGVIAVAALLPPAALCIDALLERGSDRERIDVQFVGYRIPMKRVKTCDTRGPGVWIGGGARFPGDANPDVITLNGYRGHLAEICNDPKSDALLVRQVRPGETWFQLPSQAWDLQPTDDIDTQRLVLRRAEDRVERGCIAYKNGAPIQVRSLIEFAERERRSAIRKTPAPTVRAALLKRFRGWSEDADAACVDISSGAPQRCKETLTGTAAPVFLWPTERETGTDWDLVPPRDAVWRECSGANAMAFDQTTPLLPPKVATSKRWSDWKSAAAKITVQMITRRTIGGVADQSVAIPTDRFEPLPLRLGTRYDLGFATIDQDLVVILEDPSVQLRMTDLYGGAPLPVREGEFDLTFTSPSGEELLVVDLSSRADHLTPKTVLEKVQARVTIPQEGSEFSVIAQGRPAEKRRFNEVFALDVSRSPNAIRPLLLIRRVTPPVTTFVLPLFAALLLVAATFFDRSNAPLVDVRWLYLPLLLALLDLRFAMSTRWLLNEYSSDEALRNWMVNGAYLLIGPPLVLLIATALRRGKGELRARQKTDDLYALPDEKGDPAPKSGQFRGVTTVLSRVWRRLRDRDLLPILQWLAVAAAATAVWVWRAGGERRDAISAVLKLVPTLGIAAVATIAAWLAFRAAARFAARERGGSDPFGFQPKQGRGSGWERALRALALRAAVAGAAFCALRACTYFFGSQEQLLGIRVDVLSLPLSAAILAGFTHPGEAGRAAWGRFVALGVLFFMLFVVAGGAMNDFGLVWVGGMAFVLALPAATGDRPYAYGASLILFLLIFVSPIFAPSPFRTAIRLLAGNTERIDAGGRRLDFTDSLQVSRDRDYYRLIDANQPEAVTAIPSQLAREVVIERERVRYQSLDGAWREPFRSVQTPHSPWTGAGFLRGRAVVGDPTFTRAARSDYVFPTYLRAEFGTLGLLAALAAYVALFVCGALGTVDRMRAMPLALWSTAIAAGTALFMLGGTSRIFPFSGKWPLLLSFASNSDAALAFALVALALIEKD